METAMGSQTAKQSPSSSEIPSNISCLTLAWTSTNMAQGAPVQSSTAISIPCPCVTAKM